MRVIFPLRVREQVEVSGNVDRNGSVPVGEGLIAWGTDSKNKLVSISVAFNGMPLKMMDDGVIDTAYPELREKAYRLALYASNRVLLQTNADAVDVQTIFSGSPSIEPETLEEKETVANHRQQAYSNHIARWSYRNNFDPSRYDDLFSHSEALADYCDATRAESVVLKFQEYYKVIEHFVQKEGKKFDKSVSGFAVGYDPQFTESTIKELRELRVRCTHAKPKLSAGHVSTERIAGITEVERKLKDIKLLAELFLKNHRRN